MAIKPHEKYRPYAPVALSDRTWPDQTITSAPVWCSVDLRDGNQALIEPMDSARKMRMFKTLVEMGFKEIEVGFSSASDTDFNFLRELIDGGHVPDDVTIQVLTQAREHLIERTIDSLQGAKQAILHLYNSTSTLQRRVVFRADREGVRQIAIDGAKLVADQISRLSSDTNLRLQYSPESFTGTELDYALEVCESVMEVWQPTKDNPAIINLPATVEMSSPNIYADQIEWMHRNFSNREAIILSLHPHNDRGCGIAATELGLMAGADRVEGTLFGNGERTGNVDIVTLGLNMMTQGVNPELDFSDIRSLVETAEFCNQLPIHQRHPYAGQLVHTAFSGSHQDAIRKGMDAIAKANSDAWEVPYLPIDPADIGRSYQEVIRINSQSGKGGVAYVLNRDHGLDLPRWLQVDFSASVQALAEQSESEVQSEDIYGLFLSTYKLDEPALTVGKYQLSRDDSVDQLSVQINGLDGSPTLSGKGAGVVGAFTDAISKQTGHKIIVVEYSEHTLGSDGDAEAICYVQLAIDGTRVCGVGRSTDIVHATMGAILSGLGRFSNAYSTAA